MHWFVMIQLHFLRAWRLTDILPLPLVPFAYILAPPPPRASLVNSWLASSLLDVVDASVPQTSFISRQIIIMKFLLVVCFLAVADLAKPSNANVFARKLKRSKAKSCKKSKSSKKSEAIKNPPSNGSHAGINTEDGTQ